jgi:putative ABC transport system permease protein
MPPGAGDVEDSVDDEVRFHLEKRVERLMREGLSEDEAWVEARSRFGNIDQVKAEMTREGETTMRRAATWDRLRQDLHYAVRQAFRNPAFTAVTALTLALGIGATTAIFSVVDGIVFRPLPFERPDELVAVWADWSRKGGPADEWMNFPNYFDLKERADGLAAVAAWDGGPTTVTGVGEAEQISAAFVSHDMLTEVLLVEPAVGRTFTPEDDRPGSEGTVLLTDGFWRRAFGGSTDAVGSTIALNDESHTVIGVLPKDFQPPFMPNAEVWLPLRVDRVDNYCGRGGACTLVVARLADGSSLEEAQAEATEIALQLEREYPEVNASAGLNLVRLRDDMVADARVALLVLLAAVGVVLLVACVNVANLLLARGTTRRAELAVRAALGAGRGRITWQLVTESALLAGVGGGLGIVLAYFGTDLLVGLAPAGTPRIEGVRLDLRVLAFAAVMSLLAGLFFGVVPALRAASGDLGGGLRDRTSSGSGGGASLRGRGLLVAGQVALALVLLVGAGLLVRSFDNLRNEDLGFSPGGVLTARIGLPGPRYPDGDALRAFVATLEERLGAVPGVEAVGSTSWLPLTGFGSDTNFNIEGRPIPPSGQRQAVWFRRVTDGYPEAMGMTLVAGRWITASDDATAPRVVVINDGLARRHFPGESPLGQRINLGNPDDPSWREIVGVAAEVQYFGVRDDSRDALYLPYDQAPSSQFIVAIRSERDLAGLAGEVRAVVAGIDPALAVGGVETMDDVVEASLGGERFVTFLTTLFAGLAFLLAVVGLYGVVSYGVSRRLREMGVRLALGAGGGDIGGLVLRQSLTFVAIGLVAGVVGSLPATRMMDSLLFGISATDPWTYVVVAVALAAVATVAAAIPARRAARVDPIRVLRAE